MGTEETAPGEALGRAIRVLRTLRDLSRPELAEAAEVSYSYLSEIETGSKRPSSRVLAAIAGALGTSAEELEATAAELAAAEAISPAPAAAGARVEEASSPYARSRRILFSKSLASGQPQPTLLSMLQPASSRPPRFSRLLRQKRTRSGTRVPEALLSEIHAGNCVAFVGAGFSAAAGTPGWAELLRLVTRRAGVPKQVRQHIEERIERGTSSALDEAAQVLEDELDRARFLALLGELLGEPPLTDAMLARVQHLHGIPFRAILTTNFDGILHGTTPSHAAYREALRPDGAHWWEPRYWSGEGAPTLKLHGDLASASGEAADTVVLTRRDYRKRLYDDPAYETFLRAIMATTTVLYMGFSFEDAYLNEQRSEILALLGHQRESRPVAYAIVNDVPESTVRHYRAHEGIEILSYDTRSKSGTRDFSGFDDYLAAIHEHTNPLLRFAHHLEHKRILWVDPHPQNNELAFEYLAEAARLSGREQSALVTLATPEQALALLQKTAGRNAFDLAITHWGADTGPHPAAVRLLQGLRRDDLRCPAIVFASNEDIDERKRVALGLGAQAYCCAFETLFRTIERVLAPGEETA